MPVDPQAMARLRAMVSPQNMSAPKDAYLARRTADITSGYDDMVPDADSAEMKLAQIEAQQKYGVGLSRDDLRRGPMAALRQKFGLNQQANDAAMAQERMKAETAANLTGYKQDQINQRQELKDAAIMERLDRSLGAQDVRQDKTINAQGALQEDAQQFKIENPTGGSTPTVPAPLYKALSDAEAQLPTNPVSRWMWGKSREDAVTSALEAVLDRQGVLPGLQSDLATLSKFQGTLDERIAQAGADASTLSPYERKWLARKLGIGQ